MSDTIEATIRGIIREELRTLYDLLSASEEPKAKAKPKKKAEPAPEPEVEEPQAEEPPVNEISPEDVLQIVKEICNGTDNPRASQKQAKALLKEHFDLDKFADVDSSNAQQVIDLMRSKIK